MFTINETFTHVKRCADMKFVKRVLIFVFSLVSCLSAIAQDDFLISTKWDQNTPYNNMCPVIDGTKSETGCGSTALAQILNFYKQPVHGYGELVYKSANIEDSIKVNFNDIYFDWANMQDEYSKGISETDASAQAVAQLMYACGTAVQMRYGKTSSSVTNGHRMIYGMQHYLHFSPDCRYLHRKFYTTSEWKEMLDSNLSDGHPVFYRGDWIFQGNKSGHMFVVDGVKDNQYHVNFGHSGSGDKYIDLDVINQSGYYPGNRGVCYNYEEAMVINCFPTPEYNDYPRQRCISAGAPILNGDKYLKEAEFKKGESFTLSSVLANCSGRRDTINFGWALVKDGQWLKMLNSSKYTLSSGSHFSAPVHQKTAIPNDVEDGNYQLVLYSKQYSLDVWVEVWKDAPNCVDISVKNGIVSITMPDCHNLNPLLYISAPIEEVETWRADLVPGRTFRLCIKNETTNNFEGTLKLEVIADGTKYEYETTIAVYSQTTPEYRVEIPTAACDLTNKQITSVKAYYVYDSEYFEMTTTRPSSVTDVLSNQSTSVSIYSLSGLKIVTVRDSDDNSLYQSILRNLPKGIYIVNKNGMRYKVRCE